MSQYMNFQYNSSVATTASGMPPMTPSNRKKRQCSEGIGGATTMMATPVPSQKKLKLTSSRVMITPIQIAQTEVKQRTHLLQQQGVNTPHRVKIPSFQSHRKNHRFGTPVASSKMFRTMTTTGGDRFIPNRAMTDVVKARHAMTSSKKKHSDDDDDDGAEYQRSLRRVLFGETRDSFGQDDPSQGHNDPSILSFGSSSTKATVAAKAPVCLPKDLMGFDSLQLSSTKDRKQRSKISLKRLKCLAAEGMVDDDQLSLIEYSNRSDKDDHMAIAINDTVWLATKLGGDVHSLAQAEVDGLPYSSLKWSESGELIALGTEETMEVWCPSLSQDERDNHMIVRKVIGFEGFVTAIAWKETEVVAADQGCLRRFDLSDDDLKQVTYQYDHSLGVAEFVTALEWKGHWIASAGGDTINVFRDDTRDELPCLVLNHPGVKTVEFCPFNSSLLMSGGDDGLKFWNIYNGSLRATIQIEESVVGTVFLRESNDVAVAHGNKVSVWNIAQKAAKICETVAPGTLRFVSMKGDSLGRLACASVHDDEYETMSVSIFETRRKPAGRQLAFAMDMGGLMMPVIR